MNDDKKALNTDDNKKSVVKLGKKPEILNPDAEKIIEENEMTKESRDEILRYLFWLVMEIALVVFLLALFTAK